MQKSYYAIIPANVRYDHTIPDGSKLLYGEITALCNERGYCWASNEYFADLYGKTSDTVSRWISSLKGAKYIRTEIDQAAGNKRKIYLVFSDPEEVVDPLGDDKNADTLSAKMPIPSRQKSSDPHDKNVVYNNKYNTTNNTTNNISLFDFWNTQKIVEHKKQTSTIDAALKKALKDYTDEEIRTGITNYATVLHSKKTKFSYKWTFDEFLTRKNALPVFLYKTEKDYIFTDTPYVDKVGEIKKTQEIVQKHVQEEKADKRAEEEKKREDERILRWYEARGDFQKGLIDKEIENNRLITGLSPIILPDEERGIVGDSPSQVVHKQNMMKSARSMATLLVARRHYFSDMEVMQE